MSAASTSASVRWTTYTARTSVAGSSSSVTNDGRSHPPSATSRWCAWSSSSSTVGNARHTAPDAATWAASTSSSASSSRRIRRSMSRTSRARVLSLAATFIASQIESSCNQPASSSHAKDLAKVDLPDPAEPATKNSRRVTRVGSRGAKYRLCAARQDRAAPPGRRGEGPVGEEDVFFAIVGDDGKDGDPTAITAASGTAE